jgi:toxin ParE1/3/4
VSDPARLWSVRLTAAAERDFQRIIEWTADEFGDAQARVYAQTLVVALEAPEPRPSIIGAKRRDEILKGLFSLHVARQGRKGRHFILFRVARTGNVIEVLRLLHDSMDLRRHVAGPDDAS